jgi:RimJ/RimL family protein N-acetyltransferase
MQDDIESTVRILHASACVKSLTLRTPHIYRFIEEYRGKGYGTECAQAILEYGRRHLAGHRIVGKAFVENVISIRILQKIGMRFEGYEPWHGGTLAVFVA